MLSFESCSPADNNEISEIETPENPDDNGNDNPPKPGESGELETPGENPGENPGEKPGEGSGEEPGEPESKTLVAYFSWGGTTQRMAQEIVRQTGADIFRIEPAVPYPTEYTHCIEVALEEKNSNARPAELTPAASHLTGLGLTSGRISEKSVGDWLRSIEVIK